MLVVYYCIQFFSILMWSTIYHVQGYLVSVFHSHISDIPVSLSFSLMLYLCFSIFFPYLIYIRIVGWLTGMAGGGVAGGEGGEIKRGEKGKK